MAELAPQGMRQTWSQTFTQQPRWTGYAHSWEDEIDQEDTQVISKPWYVTQDETPGNKYDWVLVAPCGCAQGVMNGAEAKHGYAAMAEFYDSAYEMGEALSKGYRVLLVTHEEYSKGYRLHMLEEWECPHKDERGFWRRFWDTLSGQW